MNTIPETWSNSGTNHILFPTDFSHHSEYTWSYVLAFAKNLNATIHTLHVIDTGFRWENQPYETDRQRRDGYSIEDEVENNIDRLK
jgi:nucleotide-binding universal stress UspA family protein